MTASMKSEDDSFLAGSDDKGRQYTERLRHYSTDKGPYIQGYRLPSGHKQLWELYHKEGRTPKNWCLQTMVLEKTPGSPLDSKEIKPVSLKGGQPWIFTGRPGAEAESLAFWSSNANKPKIYWIFGIIGKVPDAGKDWRQKGEEADKGWDGWITSPMRLIWTWADCGRW